MFKRVIWMGAGFGAGVGVTVWTEVKLRRTAQRFTPGALSEEVAGRARALRGDVRDALREGRQAMVDREAELRGDRPDRPEVIELAPVERPVTKGPSRHPRSREGGRSPAVRWVDHGHERRSARFS